MSESVKYALIGAAVMYLLTKRGQGAVTTSPTPRDIDAERPQWGANWISNQWAHIMQGQAATSGQVRPGWHF